MTEHDRVFDAFRNCITEPKCKDCPWTECETIDHGTIEIPRSLALAVMRELAAQEPRVMTLAEAQGTDYVWYESRLTGCVFPASVCMSSDTWHGDYTTDVQQIGYGGYKFVLDKEYGRAWRCWAARPTDEQREATPWNG